MQTQTMNQIPNSTSSKRVISSVAIVTALISFTMLFATLMLGFTIYRLTSPVWPPQGMKRPDLFLPILSTVIIGLSSWVYYKFETALKNKEFKLPLLMVTIVLGAGFMIAQFVFWQSLKSQGIFVSSGLYPSIIYAFTWIHAAHVVAAFFMLIWLYAKLQKETDSEMQIMRTENVGKFWHFLGIVWLIMFITIFIL